MQYDQHMIDWMRFYTIFGYDDHVNTYNLYFYGI